MSTLEERLYDTFTQILREKTPKPDPRGNKVCYRSCVRLLKEMLRKFRPHVSEDITLWTETQIMQATTADLKKEIEVLQVVLDGAKNAWFDKQIENLIEEYKANRPNTKEDSDGDCPDSANTD